MGAISNPFASETGARRYALGRPYYHPRAVSVVARQCGLRESVAAALDVGSGTGHSTRALKAIAAHVVGVDVSHPMMLQAQADGAIDLVMSRAECLPFRERSFDLISTFDAFHWLDQEAMLCEARRVLRPDGHIAFVQHGFGGDIIDCPAYREWQDSRYSEHFAVVPRHRRNWQAGLDGFEALGFEIYEDPITFTLSEMVDYFLTRSEVTTAISHGQSHQGGADWLRKEMREFFADALDRTCLFHGRVGSYRRA